MADEPTQQPPTQPTEEEKKKEVKPKDIFSVILSWYPLSH